MSEERRTIEIHICMTEDGHIVVDEDAEVAAEQAEEHFPDDDLRHVALTIELQPPSGSPEPVFAKVRID